MTNLRLIPVFLAALFLLNGCVHSQAHFSVLTGTRNAPQATMVFADADAFAKRRGFTLDNIEVMKGVKTAYYHRNANYLSIKHRTDSKKVAFNLAANADAYHQGVAVRFRRDYTRQYAGKYGTENIADGDDARP